MSSNPTLATAAFRISSQQERAWSQQEKGARLFAQCVVRLRGPVDPARLQRTLESAIANYEILRTELRKQTGVKLPFQIIQEKAELRFQQLAESRPLTELLRSGRGAVHAAEPVGLQAIHAPVDKGEQC